MHSMSRPVRRLKRARFSKMILGYELYCFAARDGAIIFGDLIGKLDVLVSVRAVEGLAESQKSEGTRCNSRLDGTF
jgi:hypothetical protein